MWMLCSVQCYFPLLQHTVYVICAASALHCLAQALRHALLLAEGWSITHYWS